MRTIHLLACIAVVLCTASATVLRRAATRHMDDYDKLHKNKAGEVAQKLVSVCAQLQKLGSALEDDMHTQFVNSVLHSKSDEDREYHKHKWSGASTLKFLLEKQARRMNVVRSMINSEYVDSNLLADKQDQSEELVESIDGAVAQIDGIMSASASEFDTEVDMIKDRTQLEEIKRRMNESKALQRALFSPLKSVFSYKDEKERALQGDLTSNGGALAAALGDLAAARQRATNAVVKMEAKKADILNSQGDDVDEDSAEMLKELTLAKMLALRAEAVLSKFGLRLQAQEASGWGSLLEVTNSETPVVAALTELELDVSAERAFAAEERRQQASEAKQLEYLEALSAARREAEQRERAANATNYTVAADQHAEATIDH